MSDGPGILDNLLAKAWRSLQVREVQKALRKVVYVDYKVKDQDLFDRAFGYVRQYY